MATIYDNRPHKDIYLKSFIRPRFVSTVAYRYNDDNIMICI